MTRVLMIGTFLSKKSGTLSVSEKLASNLNSPNVKLRLVSYRQNKVIRILDVVLSCLLLKYEKMHIDTFSGLAFRIAEIATLIGALRRKQIFLTLHGGKLPEYYVDSTLRVKQVFSRTHYIQTPSLYLKSFFTARGFDIRYLPNSIDLSKFPYSRKNISPYSLLWVRAFSNIYNPDLAVKTLFEVKKRYPDATLTMIGPDKGALSESTKLITSLGLNSSVKITGPIPNDMLFSYYQTHEAFLNTTNYESFGVAVLEAAACGIPIVSTAVGEISYLWKKEEEILLVEDFVPEHFAVEIERLFSSRTLGTTLSENARKKAEGFDFSKIRDEWIQLFSS